MLRMGFVSPEEDDDAVGLGTSVHDEMNRAEFEAARETKGRAGEKADARDVAAQAAAKKRSFMVICWCS